MDIERYKKIYNEKILRQGNQDDSKYIRLKEKETLVRILPPKEGQEFFYQFGYHIINGERHYCPKFTANKPCPICQFINKLWQSRTDEDVTLARDIKLIKRFYFNTIVRGEEDKGVRILSMGVKFWEKLIMWIANDEIGDFTDATRGFDVKIVKEEKSGYTSYDNSDLSRTPSTIYGDPKTSADALTSRYDLVDMVKLLSYQELQNVLENPDGSTNPVTSDVVVNEAETKVTAAPETKSAATPETKSAATPAATPTEPEISIDSVATEPGAKAGNVNGNADELAKFEAELKKLL